MFSGIKLLRLMRTIVITEVPVYRKKLEKELKPGSIVVSNVFSIPGWKVSDTAAGSSGGKGKVGVFVYQVPECCRGSSNVVKREI